MSKIAFAVLFATMFCGAFVLAVLESTLKAENYHIEDSGWFSECQGPATTVGGSCAAEQGNCFDGTDNRGNYQLGKCVVIQGQGEDLQLGTPPVAALSGKALSFSQWGYCSDPVQTGDQCEQCAWLYCVEANFYSDTDCMTLIGEYAVGRSGECDPSPY